MNETTISWTQLPNVVVSTVDLLHDAPGGRFETMVFRTDVNGDVVDWGAIDAQRHYFREDAVRGHMQMVLKHVEPS
jgi:hypothetical protein